MLRWLSRALFLAFVLGSAQAMDHVEQHAKLYLHACINAVAEAGIKLPEFQNTLNGKSCRDPIFQLRQKEYFPEDLDLKAVQDSRIEWRLPTLEGFSITVTDRLGRRWTGDLQHYPLVKPLHPPSPAQLAAAQLASQETFAKNYFRKCVEALSHLQLDDPSQLQALNGKSCEDIPMHLSGSPALKSVIHLRPEMEQEFEVTVTSTGGRQFHWPDSLTPKPPPPQPPDPAQAWRSWLVGLAILSVLLLALRFIPYAHWAARAGQVLFGVGLLVLLLSLQVQPVEWTGIAIALLALMLGVWLVSSLLGTVLRQLTLGKNEAVLDSFGMSLLCLLLPSPFLSAWLLGGVGIMGTRPWYWYWVVTGLAAGGILFLIVTVSRYIKAKI